MFKNEAQVFKNESLEVAYDKVVSLLGIIFGENVPGFLATWRGHYAEAFFFLRKPSKHLIKFVPSVDSKESYVPIHT